MSFEVEHKGKGFWITFDGGFGEDARNEDEVINALKHYFAKRHNRKKCPSCRKGIWE